MHYDNLCVKLDQTKLRKQRDLQFRYYPYHIAFVVLLLLSSSIIFPCDREEVNLCLEADEGRRFVGRSKLKESSFDKLFLELVFFFVRLNS